MPHMGESVVEGTVSKWLIQEGDKVQADQPLVEISTDKVDAEIPSPAAGTISKIIATEGQTLPVGALLAVIEEGAGKSTAPAAPRPAPEKVAAQPPPPPPTERAARPAEAPPPAAPSAAVTAITSSSAGAGAGGGGAGYTD